MPRNPKKSDLVRYCPAAAGGSPVWTTRDIADGYLRKDSELIEKLKSVGGLAADAPLPHIGGHCERCKPDRK